MTTTAGYILNELKLLEMQHLFCLPGLQNDPFFDHLYAQRDWLTAIHTRHEQGAAYMALGASLATGKPQAYCVVPGPGFLNTTAALATAYGLNAPVLAIAGEIPSGLIGKESGFLHEIPDQSAVMQSLTKWQTRIDRGADTATNVSRVVAELTSGRPRPVGLQVPMDVWGQDANATLSGTLPDASATVIDENAIERALELLQQAEHPLIVVGSGAQGASAPIRDIAERLQAPVASMRTGHGVVDGRSYLSASGPLAHDLWRDADVVLAIGTRLQMQQSWGTDEKLKIIHINIDPDDACRHREPEIAIVTDAAVACAAMQSQLALRNATRPSREDELSQRKAQVTKRFAGLRPQLDFLEVIRSTLPEDGIFVDELTQVGYVSRFAFPSYAPRTFLSTGYQGTLGWGFPAALGAKVVQPAKPVVSISGDGGFMFNVQELATAVHHKINTVTIVFNDSAFGNVRRIQQERLGGQVIGSDLHNPSFARLATEFGALGLDADSPDSLRQALRTGLEADRPTVIDVKVGEMPSPWEFIMLPKIRG